MTEFSYIGGHCAFISCNQFDFLPFHCEACGKSYCLSHRDVNSHNCPNKNHGSVVLPVCPLCSQKIVVGANASEQKVNMIVDQHIRQGCKNSKNRQVERCKFAGCKNKGFLNCSYCKLLFCSTHRLSFDHLCNKEKAKGVKNGNKKPFVRRYTSPPKKKIRKVKNYSSVVNKIKFKNPSKPIGNRNIDPRDQFYLDVFYSPELRHFGSLIQPRRMFFNKSWKIGRVLDAVASEGDVQNNNFVESNPHEQLNLFNLKTGFNLPVTDALEYAQKIQMLNSRDPVILVKGTELPSGFRKKCIRMLNENEKCSIM